METLFKKKNPNIVLRSQPQGKAHFFLTFISDQFEFKKRRLSGEMKGCVSEVKSWFAATCFSEIQCCLVQK